MAGKATPAQALRVQAASFTAESEAMVVKSALLQVAVVHLEPMNLASSTAAHGPGAMGRVYRDGQRRAAVWRAAQAAVPQTPPLTR